MKHIANQIKEISRSVDTIDKEQFENLVSDCLSTIADGKRIIISGLGKNGPICEKVADSMASIGIPVVYVNTGTALHGSFGYINDGDLVILISKSGNTPETIQAAKTIRANKECLILGFTFNGNSELIQTGVVDKAMIINLDQEGDPWNIMPMNSTTVTLIVLQALALELIDKLGLTKADFLKNHPGGGIGKSNKL